MRKPIHFFSDCRQTWQRFPSRSRLGQTTTLRRTEAERAPSSAESCIACEIMLSGQPIDFGWRRTCSVYWMGKMVSVSLPGTLRPPSRSKKETPVVYDCVSVVIYVKTDAESRGIVLGTCNSCWVTEMYVSLVHNRNIQTRPPQNLFEISKAASRRREPSKKVKSIMRIQ
jgi:hypothetical protein